MSIAMDMASHTFHTIQEVKETSCRNETPTAVVQAVTPKDLSEISLEMNWKKCENMVS